MASFYNHIVLLSNRYDYDDFGGFPPTLPPPPNKQAAMDHFSQLNCQLPFYDIFIVAVEYENLIYRTLFSLSSVQANCRRQQYFLLLLNPQEKSSPE